MSYQGLHLIPSSYSDDHNGKHNWRSLNLFQLFTKVPGMLVLPINPNVASHKLCNAYFLFQSSELMALMATLQDSIHPSHHRKGIPHVNPTDYFPY